MADEYSSIEAVVEAIARGEVVIVVDAEDRENEGDFVCAAEKITPEIVNFMITHGRGQVCIPVLPDVCERLKLSMMVETNTAPHGTAFTVPIDHRTNKTGITAQERAATVAAVIDPKSVPGDFARPGHMFPLLAREGGVLRRAGHTEAAIDLARLANVFPAGVLCEILDVNGNRADSAHLFRLAREFDLEIITIEQLIRYRRHSEKLVFRNADALLPTKYGDGRIIAYGVKYETQEPLAFVMGDLTKVDAPLVRMHSSCFTGDLLASLRCDCGDQLHMALQMISDHGAGVLVYLPQEGRGIGIVEKIKAYALQDQGHDTVDANLILGHKVDSREYGVGIQILKDLGLTKIRLLTNNPKKIDAFLSGSFDLQVVDQIPIVPPVHEHNAKYLATKRDKLGHTLPGKP
ncbi:MAG: GTP cyclohydrolase II [Planctomycetia bacterium]|nr:GTP cyclohydrolase II [Planctomycetia bacterium]